MQGKSGDSTKRSGAKRATLVVFVALFVALFVGFAIAEGLGDPSVADGDVALIESVPDGTISEAELKKGVARKAAQQVAAGELKKAPKPGSDKYEELQEAELTELVEGFWIRGEAEELNISVTDKQIEDELDQIKQQNFPTPAAYKEFLETSEFNQEDVDKLVELQLLSQEIQETINGEAPEPSKEEISKFYEAAKSTQFVSKPSRDIRIVTSKDKADVEAAQKALEADSTPANWKKVATKYSEDPSTKSKGGLQEGLSEEILPEPLKKEVFSAATGELLGPIAFQGNFTVIEVVKLNPENTQTLKEVESQITTQLAQQLQQEHFSEFATDWQSRWRSNTFCASGFEIPVCDNFKGTGLPATAPPGCFEADPKTTPTECPAPVQQSTPALPGSVSVLEPQGERLAQRPRPLETGEPGAEEGAAPLPEGTEVPPTGE